MRKLRYKKGEWLATLDGETKSFEMCIRDRYKDIQQKEYFDCKAILFAMKLTCGIARYDVKTPRLEKEEIHFCIRTIYDIIYKLEVKK